MLFVVFPFNYISMVCHLSSYFFLLIGAKRRECESKHSSRPDVENKSDVESSAGQDSHGCSGTGSDHAKEIADEVAAADDPHGCDDAGLHCANETSDEVVAADNKSDMNSLADPHGCDDDACLHHTNEITDEVAAIDNTSDMDSSAGHDPHGCDDACLHCANDSADNKSGIDATSGHGPHGCDDACLPCANDITDDVAAADSSFLDASHKLKIPFLTERAVCSDSLSGDKLTASASEKKCESPSNASHDAPFHCPVVSLNNTSVKSRSVDVSHEVTIPVFVEGTTSFDSHSEDKLALSASVRIHMFPSDIGHDAPALENEPVMDCPVVDNAQSLRESDVDEAHEVNINVDRLKPVPSSGEVFAENTTKEMTETLDVSYSTRNGHGEGSLQFKTDSNIQIACERKSRLHAFDDNSENDAHERKTESGSV